MDDKYYISRILSILTNYGELVEKAAKDNRILEAAYYGHKLIHNLYVELLAMQDDKEVKKETKKIFEDIYKIIKAYIEGQEKDDIKIIGALLKLKEIVYNYTKVQEKEIKKL